MGSSHILNSIMKNSKEADGDRTALLNKNLKIN